MRAVTRSLSVSAPGIRTGPCQISGRARAICAVLIAVLCLIAPPSVYAQDTVAVGPGETIVLDGITLVNASGQPANVALANGVLDVALPIGVAAEVQGAACMAVVPAPNFARCQVMSGARVTLGSVGGLAALQPPSPSPQATPPAQPPFPQPPMALARAGTGGPDADVSSSRWALVALTAYAGCFAVVAVAIRRRANR
jgi:hypothetical protein